MANVTNGNTNTPGNINRKSAVYDETKEKGQTFIKGISNSLSKLSDLDLDAFNSADLDIAILSHSDSSRSDSLDNDGFKKGASRDRGESNSTVDSLENPCDRNMSAARNASQRSGVNSIDSLEQDVTIGQDLAPSRTDHHKMTENHTGFTSSGQPSKIPRSKTFDSSSIGKENSTASNSQSGSQERQARSSPRSFVQNRAHIFMTSNECVVIPGARLPKENKSSKLRFEKQHSAHDCEPGSYQTPLQRKEQIIKALKRDIKDLNAKVEEKDREIALYKQTVDSETSLLVEGKDEEIRELRDEVKRLREANEDLNSFCEESLSAAAKLEGRVSDLKDAMEEREKQHEQQYLKMYRKGQNSAHFEREEELEQLAESGGCKVTISELVKKLAWTEVELAKWQTIRRDEIYHDALQPETETDATFRFLRDSFFHYLTDTKESAQHLRAMIKIFRFTEPQLKKIEAGKVIENIKKKKAKHK